MPKAITETPEIAKAMPPARTDKRRSNPRSIGKEPKDDV
jgi:hypothetical protein